MHHAFDQPEHAATTAPTPPESWPAPGPTSSGAAGKTAETRAALGITGCQGYWSEGICGPECASAGHTGVLIQHHRAHPSQR